MNTGEILIYQNSEGSIKLDVRLEDETVWLTQAQLCDLFQKSKATISEHIKNDFEEVELNENSVVRNFRTTSSDGKSYDVNYYNLDVLISSLPFASEAERREIQAQWHGLQKQLGVYKIYSKSVL